MKILVVYDSFFGNTEKIAQAIGAGLDSGGQVFKIGDVTPDQLAGLDLLVVGSPTRQFAMSPATKALLKDIPSGALRGVKVAAFDTRYPQSEIEKTPALDFFVRLFGRSAFAAHHIAKQLNRRGGQPAAPPEGFFVTGVEGPLLENELERAADWGRLLAAELA